MNDQPARKPAEEALGFGAEPRRRRHSPEEPGGFVLLIPALNEEDAIGPLLRAIDPGTFTEIVVVDNGSTDDTASRAREAGATVLVEGRRGYGSACLRGLSHVFGLQPPPAGLVFLDADHPEHLDALPDLLRPLASGEADLVLGARVSWSGARGNLRPHARVGNAVILGLSRLLFGLRHRDLGPFRAVSTDCLRRLHMDDRDWGWTLQMQIRAVRAGCIVREIDVPHAPRQQGRSKISGSLVMSLRVGGKMLFTLTRERLRRLPR